MKLKPPPEKERLRFLIVEKKMTSTQIASELGYSWPTILKYARLHGLGVQLSQNGRLRQSRSLYKDGRASYRKHKKSFCELCGASNVRLEVHHKTPVKYDAKWSIIIEGDHSPENLLTVCNSCHQKTHYREHGRKAMKSDGRRFYSHK